MIEKLSKIWAGSIAYVMLLVGGGLSVAGNVADVYRTRGAAVDGLDIILAGAWPVLVILTIEGFVSRRWSPRAGFQALRWAGCLAVGSMAMMASWVHLHDLMASRGQIMAVATGGPLAIDGMAIMATGLLLSTRGQLAIMAMSTPVTTTPYVATEADVAESEAAFRGVSMDILPENKMSTIADEARSWLDTLATSALDSTTTPAVPLDVQPVSPAPYGGSNAVRPESVPGEVAMLIMAWESAPIMDRPTLKDMTTLLAAHTGRSERTIRRQRDALKAA